MNLPETPSQRQEKTPPFGLKAETAWLGMVQTLWNYHMTGEKSLTSYLGIFRGTSGCHGAMTQLAISVQLVGFCMPRLFGELRPSFYGLQSHLRWSTPTFWFRSSLRPWVNFALGYLLPPFHLSKNHRNPDASSFSSAHFFQVFFLFSDFPTISRFSNHFHHLLRPNIPSAERNTAAVCGWLTFAHRGAFGRWGVNMAGEWFPTMAGCV